MARQTEETRVFAMFTWRKRTNSPDLYRSITSGKVPKCLYTSNVFSNPPFRFSIELLRNGSNVLVLIELYIAYTHELFMNIYIFTP